MGIYAIDNYVPKVKCWRLVFNSFLIKKCLLTELNINVD